MAAETAARLTSLSKCLDTDLLHTVLTKKVLKSNEIKTSKAYL